MLDQKSNETFMRAQRCAMNADRNLLGIIAVLVAEVEPARLREVDLVGGERKFASDHTPNLHVDLWSIKRGFIRHLNIINFGTLQYIARHLLSLLPKNRFVDKLLSQLRRIMR